MTFAISHVSDSLIVSRAEETEKYAPAELPAPDSLAVEEEMLAFQHEFPIPSIVHLLKNAEQLLFLAHSARHGSAEEADVYSLLETFSRYRGENAHIVGEIGAAARRLAGHLRASAAYFFEGEELGAFHALQTCQQAAADLRIFSHEGRDRFGGMAELSTHLLEHLTGQKRPWGLRGNFCFRPVSETPRGFKALDAFLAEQDGIWRRRNLAKERLAEAKNGYPHDFHVTREMEKAERDGNGLAVIPLIFQAFSATMAPAATALQGEEPDAGPVLEGLVSFSECRLALLPGIAGQIALIERAALAGDFRGAALQALAAAIPIFQEIANIMEDFYEFCDALDDGRYLSFLPQVRLEAMLTQAREGRSREERRTFYAGPPAVREAFMSMARIQAVSRLCAVYCARHEEELPQKDSLQAFLDMTEEDRHPSKLAAVLTESFNSETLAEALRGHTRLLERRERLLAALPAEPVEGGA